jgi:hypothetical protein
LQPRARRQFQGCGAARKGGNSVPTDRRVGCAARNGMRRLAFRWPKADETSGSARRSGKAEAPLAPDRRPLKAGDTKPTSDAQLVWSGCVWSRCLIPGARKGELGRLPVASRGVLMGKPSQGLHPRTARPGSAETELSISTQCPGTGHPVTKGGTDGIRSDRRRQGVDGRRTWHCRRCEDNAGRPVAERSSLMRPLGGMASPG